MRTRFQALLSTSTAYRRYSTALSERETKVTNLDVGNNGIGYEAGKFIADYIKVGWVNSAG